MGDIMTDNGKTFLDTATGARMHARWWTALPAIPPSPAMPAYRRLRRQFADHTMNTWRETDEGVRPGGRGFYVEGREDHLVPAAVENFAMFSDTVWFEEILRQVGHPPVGSVEDVNWTYSYEEKFPDSIRIADIVFMWRDAGGEAVLVFEAKKPGAGRKLVEKDLPPNGYYLAFGAFQPIRRRYQALLLDQRDSDRLPDAARPVLTWQSLLRIQVERAAALPIESDLRDTLIQRLKAHHAILGFGAIPAPTVAGDEVAFARFESEPVDASLKAWLLGSELFFAARQKNAAISVPYRWLLQEKSASDYRAGKLQSTADRRRPLWRLDEPG